MKANFILLLIILTLPVTVFADDEETLQQLRSLISAQEAELSRMETDQTELVSQISLLQKNQSDLRRAITLTSNQIAANRGKISELQQEMNALTTKSRQYEQQARQGMVFLLDNSGTLTARAVLSGNDTLKTATAIELLSMLNTNLTDKIEQYTQTIAELSLVKAEIDSVNTRLVEDQKANEKQIVDLRNTNEQISIKLVLVRQDANAQREYLEMLSAEEKRLTDIINSRKIPNVPESSEFSKKQGLLAYPISGKVIEQYGRHLVAEAGIEIMHKGIKIQPLTDGNVKTIFDGTVVFVDNIMGMGNIIIVQHDSEYYSVYGNLDEFYVRNNDKVAQNSSIGRINVDLKSDLSYLYFEIRRHEEALNPSVWLEQ